MEIFAPAGNFDSMLQAVENGADCVYLGMDVFNARMKADNFNPDNFSEAVGICHLFGVKVYLTLNILIKPKEFSEALNVAAFAYNNGADGIICADYGLTAFLAANLPADCDITFSTQANIQNAEGCLEAKSLGVNSVVVSREVDRETIRDIKTRCPGTSLEYFVQGALCVCVSGQCQLSSAVDVYSGNRGQCKQPCRQYYSAFENGKKLAEGYLLSPKDLSLADKIDELKNLGINRIKIEGRNRRKEYVGESVRIYRKAVNGGKITDNDKIRLKKMFNRGDYTRGYLYEGNSPSLMSTSIQGHKGVKCGVVAKITDKFCLINADYTATKGDAYKIIRLRKEVGSAVCVEILGNNTVKAAFNGKVKEGDAAHITSDNKLLSEFDKFTRKAPLEMIVEARIGNKMLCRCRCDSVEKTVESDFVCEKAVKSPLSSAEIANQLSKLGDTYFTITNIVVDSDDIFVAKSQLNEFRRKIVSRMYSELTASRRQKILLTTKEGAATAADNAGRVAVVISESAQVEAARLCDIIIVSPDVYDSQNIARFDIDAFYLDIPNFLLKKDVDVIKQILSADKRIIGVCANSLGGVYLAKEFSKKLLLGPGMNIFNDYSVGLWKDYGYDFVYSNELSLNEINDFRNKDGFVYAEGNICCMTLAHCPIKLVKNCSCDKCKYHGDITYKDRLNNEFLIKRKVVSKCYFELINTHRLSTCGKIDSRRNFYLNLRGMSAEESKRTIDSYLSLVGGGNNNEIPILKNTTNGHLFKKVK